MNERIQEVLEVIDLLPPNLAKKLSAVLFLFINVLAKIHLFPTSWREKIANTFAHNVLKVFKLSDKDSKRIREGIVYWTIELWDLDETWAPGFSLDPPT